MVHSDNDVYLFCWMNDPKSNPCLAVSLLVLAVKCMRLYCLASYVSDDLSHRRRAQARVLKHQYFPGGGLQPLHRSIRGS